MSRQRPEDIYERWLYRVAVPSDSLVRRLNQFVVLPLPALLTEMVIEAEWLGPTGLQRAARNALVLNINAMCPALSICADRLFDRESKMSPLEAVDR